MAFLLQRARMMSALAVLQRAAAHLGGPRVLALPLLRTLAVVLGVLWVALTPTDDPRRGPAALVLACFVVYSTAVVISLWKWTVVVLRRNCLVVLGDVGFALALIAVSGGAGSALFLALLVIAGLQSYYWGMVRGLVVGLACAAGYLAVSWPTLHGEWANVVVRMATMFGAIVGIGVLADLEARERRKAAALGASVIQTEKLAALGTLAAGVAHELNNPIGVISSRVELMLLDADAHHLPKQVRDDLGVLHRQAQRVAKIAGGLLSFARHSPRERRPIDLNELVEDTFALLEKPLVKQGVGLRRDLQPALPSIVGDPHALQQVLVNLLTNARDAIGGGGEIQVRTTASADGRDVRLVVRDTGSGISPAVLSRIFDPFFTTKAEGTGLGLSISYGIVRDHHGTIEVSSQPDEGTTFTLTFPAAWTRDRE